MKMICITFRSITPAQQGQRYLRSRGVDVALQRTPRWMEERGCGYCLRLRPERLELAVELLREAGFSFSKIYAEENGDAVELFL